MLFNSLPFEFGFLPTVLLGFYVLGRWSGCVAAAWLVAASLFFYAWWNVSLVWLLLASATFNYGVGWAIGYAVRNSKSNIARALLTLGVAADLLLLGYYKYAGFFAGILNQLSGSSLNFGAIILPLGISFFTFAQIAFLVDAFQQDVADYRYSHYLLFVTYFPHLIAGPILHHRQIIPQFAERRIYHIDWANMSAGLTFFGIGLSKKVLLADRLAGIATPVFAAAQNGGRPLGIEAWAGAIAYTLQLYFDFSGYSDMAIGISLFFNVKLPLNFNSPYKATSIIDFWRRWHMTLAAFLRDYLYIPLGGNRKGKPRRYVNLMVTMLLGGLWHGAAWTFVLWGALHGLFLVINHVFRASCARLKPLTGWSGRWGRFAAGAATFVSVVIAWVIFRSDSFATAGAVLHGMANGFVGPTTLRALASGTLVDWSGIALILGCLAIVWLLPNSQQFMRGVLDAKSETIANQNEAFVQMVWAPERWWTWSAVGVLLGLSILMMAPAGVSKFLYYQF